MLSLIQLKVLLLHVHDSHKIYWRRVQCLDNWPWLLELLAKLVKAAILNNDWWISLYVCQSISLRSWSWGPLERLPWLQLLQRWNLCKNLLYNLRLSSHLLGSFCITKSCLTGLGIYVNRALLL